MMCDSFVSPVLNPLLRLFCFEFAFHHFFLVTISKVKTCKRNQKTSQPKMSSQVRPDEEVEELEVEGQLNHIRRVINQNKLKSVELRSLVWKIRLILDFIFLDFGFLLITKTMHQISINYSRSRRCCRLLLTLVRTWSWKV